MSVDNVFQLIKDKGVQFIDVQFGDLFGTLHHFTLPAKLLEAEHFEDGLAFDGSSIRAWKSIDKSDMMLVPDPASAYIDPFREYSTLCLIGKVIEPRTGQLYDRCPRSIAEKALNYLKSLGIGDTVFFGPEPEFFVFDGLRYASTPGGSFYEIDSIEAPWTAADDDGFNQAHKIRHKGGYFPTSPSDSLVDLRNEVCLHMEEMGIEVEVHHHEVATAGQCEIGHKFSTILEAADNVHKLKYAVKNAAYQHGKLATFMPKPLFGDNGSGMHIHTSIWKDGENLFAGDGYAKLSQTALWAIGGILKHGRAIQAFTNPTANSYRRLVPGYEAPVTLAYSATNRSASVRIPHVTSDKARRFEFRCPDSSGSPYLAFAAMLMAMIDGIQNQVDPGQAMDKNIYDLPPEELATMTSTCATLEEAINELEADSDWLTAGDVFTPDTIAAYADYKREEEITPLKLRPNPLEFELYHDC
ncbi:MAG: type I glutamate--ammonia ligase [Planctomycetota bacterium]|jgi:glutamine synthetase